MDRFTLNDSEYIEGLVSAAPDNSYCSWIQTATPCLVDA